MYIVRLKNKARGMVQVSKSKSYEEILQTEYNQKFDDKVIKALYELYDYNTVEDLGNEHRFIDIRQRMMVMSYYKYGEMEINYKRGKHLNAIGSLEKRLEAYEFEGNTELLCDIGNFAMIEYTYPTRDTNCEIEDEGREVDNNLEELKRYLKLYKDKGNKDCLCYVAAIAMAEFMRPQHKKSHYKKTDGKYEVVGYGINQLKSM